MKIFWSLVGGLAAIVLVLMGAGLYVFSHYDRGAPPIPPSRAMNLLNDCYRFTNVDGSTRRVTEITSISKGGGGSDAGADMDTVAIRWRWMSGPKAKDPAQKPGEAVFYWSPVPGLRDWNFPESQWHLSRFEQSGDEDSFDCTTPTLIQ